MLFLLSTEETFAETLNGNRNVLKRTGMNWNFSKYCSWKFDMGPIELFVLVEPNIVWTAFIILCVPSLSLSHSVLWVIFSFFSVWTNVLLCKLCFCEGLLTTVKIKMFFRWHLYQGQYQGNNTSFRLNAICNYCHGTTETVLTFLEVIDFFLRHGCECQYCSWYRP